MNFFIPFSDYKNIGGPKTFMHNLKNYLDSKEYKYHSEYQSSNNIFFPIYYNLSILDNIKKNNKKILQRLDGIYYPSKHGEKYLEFNKDIKKIYTEYADHVIFQSNYSKKQCFKMFGPIKKYSIIINGADTSIFYPNSKTFQKENINIISTGNFRSIDMIEPIIKACDLLYIKNKTFKLHLVGPFINKDLDVFLKRDYIKLHGPKKLNEVAQKLRECDIFIFSQINPPCPNSIIEAISTGLPIISFNTGAIKELCNFNKELLAYVNNSTFQEYKDFNSIKLFDKLSLCIDNYTYFKKNAIINSRNFTIEKCGEKYLTIFNKIIKVSYFP